MRVVKVARSRCAKLSFFSPLPDLLDQVLTTWRGRQEQWGEL